MRPGRGAVALGIVAFSHCCLFGQTPGGLAEKVPA